MRKSLKGVFFLGAVTGIVGVITGCEPCYEKPGGCPVDTSPPGYEGVCDTRLAHTEWTATVDVSGDCNGSGQLTIACAWVTTDNEKVCLFGSNGFTVTDSSGNGYSYSELMFHGALPAYMEVDSNGDPIFYLLANYQSWHTATTPLAYRGWEVAHIDGNLNTDSTVVTGSIDNGPSGSGPTSWPGNGSAAGITPCWNLDYTNAGTTDQNLEWTRSTTGSGNTSAINDFWINNYPMGPEECVEPVDTNEPDDTAGDTGFQMEEPDQRPPPPPEEYTEREEAAWFALWIATWSWYDSQDMLSEARAAFRLDRAMEIADSFGGWLINNPWHDLKWVLGRVTTVIELEAVNPKFRAGLNDILNDLQNDKITLEQARNRVQRLINITSACTPGQNCSGSND